MADAVHKHTTEQNHDNKREATYIFLRFCAAVLRRDTTTAIMTMAANTMRPPAPNSPFCTVEKDASASATVLTTTTGVADIVGVGAVWATNTVTNR